MKNQPSTIISFQKGSFWDRYSEFLRKSKINLLTFVKDNIFNIDHIESVLGNNFSDLLFIDQKDNYEAVISELSSFLSGIRHPEIDSTRNISYQ